MYIIVGLGNPTRQYEGTKHNVGFDTIDYLIDEYQIPSSGAGHKALFGKGMIAGQKVIVAKPMTYMNPSFRRSIKVVNQACDVLFENEEGEIDNIFEDQMPFDTDADVIEIDDADYGIWYVDMGDNPERYEGKTVHFRGMVLKSKDVGADFFVPGRMAMTCCADDTSFIGYVCKCASAKSLVMGSWVDVTATVKWGYMKVYDGEGPVLYAKEIKPAKKPESELVYFN